MTRMTRLCGGVIHDHWRSMFKPYIGYLHTLQEILFKYCLLTFESAWASLERVEMFFFFFTFLHLGYILYTQ